MTKLRHQQSSLWHPGLTKDIEDLWEPWMRLVDRLLEDEQLLDTIYHLRHSFISMLGERGVPLQVVGAMVGHMSPAMVRYYTHISGQAARQAVDMLEKIREAPKFVDVLVDVPQGQQGKSSTLLN